MSRAPQFEPGNARKLPQQLQPRTPPSATRQRTSGTLRSGCVPLLDRPLCVERMFWAARRSGDPLWVAVAADKRGHLQLLAGAYDAGLRATAAAVAEVAGDERPPALAGAGTLHCGRGSLPPGLLGPTGPAPS